MSEITSPITPAQPPAKPAKAAIEMSSRPSDVFKQDRLGVGSFAFTNRRAEGLAIKTIMKRSTMDIQQEPKDSAHSRADLESPLKNVDI